MLADTILAGAQLLLQLGLEIYKAIKAGETDKTVGEILAGMRTDGDIIAELDALAVEEYKRRP